MLLVAVPGVAALRAVDVQRTPGVRGGVVEARRGARAACVVEMGAVHLEQAVVDASVAVSVRGALVEVRLVLDRAEHLADRRLGEAGASDERRGLVLGEPSTREEMVLRFAGRLGRAVVGGVCRATGDRRERDHCDRKQTNLKLTHGAPRWRVLADPAYTFSKGQAVYATRVNCPSLQKFPDS